MCSAAHNDLIIKAIGVHCQGSKEIAGASSLSNRANLQDGIKSVTQEQEGLFLERDNKKDFSFVVRSPSLY